jgi:hypothetical protein
MYKSKMRKYYSLLTLIYLLLLTVYYLLPGGLLPWNHLKGISLLVHFSSYGLLTWLSLAALGSCPLRWRNLAPWIFVIALAHIFWMGYLQGLFPDLNRRSTYSDLLVSCIGAVSGILLRIRLAYRQCNCSMMAIATRAGTPAPVTMTETPIGESNPELPITIANHPDLNSIIAGSFRWKALQLQPATGITIDMVCTGKSFVSLPHFSYGNIHNGTGKAITASEWQEILSGFALPRNIAQMEVRVPWPDQPLESIKIASWLNLSDSMDKQMHAFHPNLRRKIRKGLLNGFTVEQGSNGLLNDFWHVYARHMDRLGSVALPKRFFDNLLHQYTQGNVSIFLLRYKGRVVGGSFNLAYRGFYENGWFATLQNVQGRYASYVLHQAMIGHAIKLQCHTYSFGRSTNGSGVHRFKHQWGADDVPLLWAHYPVQKLNLRKQRWLHAIWKIFPWLLRQHLGSYLAKWVY